MKEPRINMDGSRYTRSERVNVTATPIRVHPCPSVVKIDCRRQPTTVLAPGPSLVPAIRSALPTNCNQAFAAAGAITRCSTSTA